MIDEVIKVLEIGPSVTRSKGGMATVIAGINEDKESFIDYKIDVFESFIDGNTLKRLIFCIISYIKFYFLYKEYDIFHIHMASYGSTFRKMKYIKLLKKKNKKVIVHIHGASYMDFYESLSNNGKKRVTNVINQADIIIALSDTWKNLFENEVGLKNVKVLKNGIDSECFVDARSIQDDMYNKILFLGRLGKRKGAYDLIYSIKKLKDRGIDIKCIMAGDGEVEEVKSLSKELKIDSNVKCVGWIDINKKKEFLRKSGILVLPSYNEGLPMAILEGMAAGKVIISTTVGAIPEVIKNRENGILIEAGDIEALTNAIEEIVNNKKLAEQISLNNVEKIEREFERKKMHLKLNEYFDCIYQEKEC